MRYPIRMGSTIACGDSRYLEYNKLSKSKRHGWTGIGYASQRTKHSEFGLLSGIQLEEYSSLNVPSISIFSLSMQSEQWMHMHFHLGG